VPPARELEHYVELTAAVEAAAEALAQPIILEGYAPPNDPRISNFRVTPDPESSKSTFIPPPIGISCRSGPRFCTRRRESRVWRPRNSCLDGRHTGTGGGNHIVLGGASAPDSPFLRRPDLLRSLLGYWHNHPSLSYLFSGLFIGPTSQAPRVDEARNDSCMNLNRLPPIPETRRECSAVAGGRLLRNLLIDVSGNTHRTEFCIDKLYSPDGPTGRLGLVEMRAFEMPPHARMSLTQQLLLRAMVARFWRSRMCRTLVRWGTELHDRFLMPYFVEQDFADVIAEMRQEGFGLEAMVRNRNFEFRFPKYGDFASRGMQLELRQALEPLARHGRGGCPGRPPCATWIPRWSGCRSKSPASRRIGIWSPATAAPYRCSDRCVGEFVGAVRYRAWQPASALHPGIGVHAPLTFDLFDAWISAPTAALGSTNDPESVRTKPPG